MRGTGGLRPHDADGLIDPEHVERLEKGVASLIPTPAERFRRYTVRGNTTFRKNPSDGKQSAGVGMMRRGSAVLRQINVCPGWLSIM